MSDLIRRSDAVKAVSAVDDYGDGIGFEVRSHCLVELELVPSADRPRGEWMAKNSHTMYCSVCGFEEVAWRTQDYGYCPNCGAKMDGERGE